MTHYFLRWLTQGWQASRPVPVVCHEARPPWAIEESQYLSLCTRCGECFKACPNGLLKPASQPEYEGTAIAGTPVLDLACGQCSYCGSCARACPTGALDLQWGRQVQTRVQIEASCQAKQGFYCLLCEDACPQQAIKATSDGVSVNMAACDGCGACGLACLHGAITLIPQL
ncbi:ferredoxin-type protein NapF [Aeromonas salmonicida]|uniref:ferredoxin-type protein NapF n=1 Tax=Aeromonas salmonicida TaxID=645 RepID=UPI003CF82BF8